MDSIGTHIYIREASEPMDIARIAELSKRTNQFNLSGRRYSEDELFVLIGSGNYCIYELSESDRFGDLGIVAASVVRFEGGSIVIEEFLPFLSSLFARI